jgi:putative flippase GtrA
MRAWIEALIPSPFVRFVFAGGIAAGVNIMSRILLSQVVRYEIAIVIAYLIAMTLAYLLMMLFVFDASGKSAANEYMRFTLVNLAALVQVWLVSVGLSHWFFLVIGFNWHAETTAHVIGVLSPVATSYLGHKLFTFAPQQDRAV